MAKNGKAQTRAAGSRDGSARTPAGSGGKADGRGKPRRPAAAPKPKKGAAALAEQVLADENAAGRTAAFAAELLDERDKTATQAARVLSEVLAQKPELVVTHVERFALGLESPHKRVTQTAAEALPVIARLAPARVARHLDTLKSSFDRTSDVGQDGLVRTFANLCIASVAYQKRLEPILTRALRDAEAKTLPQWSDVVLPALKGEPHARARAVVEDRLPTLPRAAAQKLADQLGVKLRPSPR